MASNNRIHDRPGGAVELFELRGSGLRIAEHEPALVAAADEAGAPGAERQHIEVVQRVRAARRTVVAFAWCPIDQSLRRASREAVPFTGPLTRP
jgi:hypothetical protein